VPELLGSPFAVLLEFILDWHNEWYDAAQRRAIYDGQAAMDCPLCRQAVLWFESRDIAAPPANAQPLETCARG
jgi:hypothetical protein